MATADDWELLADLGTRLKFPEEVTSTNLRPDIVLLSRRTKQLAIVELTVPWETRMEEAHERKLTKYQQLVWECKDKGWKAWNFPVEIGCRGFASNSLWRALGRLGISGQNRRTLIAKAGDQAERASSWLWRKREEGWKC